ncbi:MAG: translation initiation factor IF-1 [Verrucomicrobiales bacterium]|jgi:translation initiation factor IF-1
MGAQGARKANTVFCVAIRSFGNQTAHGSQLWPNNPLHAIARPRNFRRGGGGRRRNPQRGPRSKNPTDESTEQKSVEIEGTISSVLAGTMFKVALPSGHEVLAHISGKMRKRFIRLVIGDRVKMEMSPYDTTKARIVFRLG